MKVFSIQTYRMRKCGNSTYLFISLKVKRILTFNVKVAT